MKRHWLWITTCAALLALIPAGGGALFAGETEGEVAVGGRSVDLERSRNRAAEYRTTDSGVDLRAWLEGGLGPNGRIALDLEYLDADEQSYALTLGNGSSLFFEASYDSFLHNLPHDPLTNLAAWDGEGKIVSHTDEDPGRLYGLGVDIATAALTFRPGGDGPLSFGIEARELSRGGTTQHRSTSHCYSCHVVGQSRAIDETVDDVRLRVSWAASGWDLRYEYGKRSFDDQSPLATRWFEPAHHPAKTTPTGAPLPVFGNRLQYGVLPNGAPAWYEGAVGLRTEFDRSSHVLQAGWDGSADHVQAVAARYSVESDPTTARGGVGTGYTLDYDALRLRWLHRYGKATSLRLSGGYEKIDSTDAAIPLVENVALAGPTAGLTYAEVYGSADLLGYVTGEVTWDPDELRVRRSAVDRKVIEAGASLVHRFGEGRRQRLRVSLDRRSVDRANYAVNDAGGTTTDEYTLALRYSARTKSRRTHYRAAAEWYSADDPFTNVDGACRLTGTDPDDGVPPGFPWNTAQYFQLYALRFANLSNQPTDALEISGQLTLAPSATSSVTFQGRWGQSSNDQTQTSDWQEDLFDLGASAWWAPNPKLYLIASVQRLERDQDTHLCIPLMGG